MASGCNEFFKSTSSGPRLRTCVFTSDDKASHRVFSSSSSWHVTPARPPASLGFFPAPDPLAWLPRLSRLRRGRGTERDQVTLQTSAWERTGRAAAGAFWAVPASSCWPLPRCYLAARSCAGPSLCSRCGNLRSLKYSRVGGRGEEGWGRSDMKPRFIQQEV